MPYHYPVVSDLELQFPYRVRYPLALAGYPTLPRRGASRRPPLHPFGFYPSDLIPNDPWWYEMPALRTPPGGWRNEPGPLRQTFLSPVKRTFVWSRHPMRNNVLRY